VSILSLAKPRGLRLRDCVGVDPPMRLLAMGLEHGLTEDPKRCQRIIEILTGSPA
jgi:hypothetical protein